MLCMSMNVEEIKSLNYTSICEKDSTIVLAGIETMTSAILMQCFTN